MNEDIKQKINEKSDEWEENHKISFKYGAEYGYSLAEQEIERLKGLLITEHKSLISSWFLSNEEYQKEVQQFKTTHNL